MGVHPYRIEIVLKKRSCPVLLALALPIAAHAVVLPEGAHPCENLAFADAKGFEKHDPARLTGKDWYTGARFPGQDSAGIRLPDADLDPATRALLLLEANEPAIESARWELRYRLMAHPDVPEVTCAAVEARRYNLTTALHRDRVETYGSDAAPAGPEARHPHVAWRFLMSPVQGIRADVTASGRREIPAAEAARAMCLGERCLALNIEYGEGDGFKAWNPEGGPQAPRYVATWPAGAASDAALASPARAVEELFHQATADGEEPAYNGPGNPQLTIVLARNDGAQDHVLRGVLKQAELMDDAIAEIWFTRLQVPGHVEWKQKVVARPGYGSD